MENSSAENPKGAICSSIPLATAFTKPATQTPRSSPGRRPEFVCRLVGHVRALPFSLRWLVIRTPPVPGGV